MAQTINNIINAASNGEEVCTDKDSLLDKQKVMRKQRFSSLFYSTADTLKTIASVLTPVGIAVLLPTVIENFAAKGLIGALTMAPAATLVLAGVSIAATFMAIGAHYLSSRYYHSGNFDALELNAQHTAKYLVKEIKRENACLTEQPGPQRADGKSWAQFVRSQESGVQSQSL